MALRWGIRMSLRQVRKPHMKKSVVAMLMARPLVPSRPLSCAMWVVLVLSTAMKSLSVSNECAACVLDGCGWEGASLRQSFAAHFRPSDATRIAVCCPPVGADWIDKSGVRFQD